MQYRHSEAVRAKMSEAWKRRRLIPVSAETRLRQSLASKGKPKSAQHRLNISKGKTGKPKRGVPISVETKRKISETRKTFNYKPWLGRKHSEETKAKIGLAHSGEKATFWKDGRMKNKEYVRLYARLDNQKRRALGIIDPYQWAMLKLKFHHTCPACGVGEPDIVLTIDHIVPVSRGGTNDIENLQPLCGPCNSRKKDMIAHYDPIARTA